ncbi:MAG: hypothetical protein ACUVXF_08885 [Desulfobaccales bacterium]
MCPKAGAEMLAQFLADLRGMFGVGADYIANPLVLGLVLVAIWLFRRRA